MRGISRRTFLTGVAGAGSLAAIPTPLLAGESKPTATAVHQSLNGQVLVMSSDSSLVPELAMRNIPSFLTVADIQSKESFRIPSPVYNLHDVIRVAPEEDKAGCIYAIGKGCDEVLQMLSLDYKHTTTLRFPGITFRGHAINHAGGALITAEATDHPMQAGYLLHFNGSGDLLGRYSSGGISPHHIIDTGSYYAVSHYGALPYSDREQNPDGPDLTYTIEKTGIAFLDKQSLEVIAFHETPKIGVASHIGALSDGSVLAFATQYTNFGTDPAGLGSLYEQASKDEVDLLLEEVKYGSYGQALPIFRVHPEKGVVGTIEEAPSKMRDGQSFAFNRSVSLVAATFPASNTLMIHDGQTPSFFDALKFGIAEPRGCVFVPGTDVLAVSGDRNNIALIDTGTMASLGVISGSFGLHAHAHWLPA